MSGEEKPPWKVPNASTGKEYPIWEKLSESEALSTLGIIRRHDQTYLDQQNPQTEEEKAQLLKEGEALKAELERVGSHILRRCYRLDPDYIDGLSQRDFNDLIGQFVLFCIGKRKPDFRY